MGGETRAGDDVVTVLVLTHPQTRDLADVRSRLAEVLRGVEAEVLYVVDAPQSSPERLWSTALDAAGALRSAAPRRTSRQSGPGDDWVVVIDPHRHHAPGMVARLLRTGRRTRADLVLPHDDAVSTVRAGSSARRSRPSTSVDRLAASLVPSRWLTHGSRDIGGVFAVRRTCVAPGRASRRGADRPAPRPTTRVAFSYAPDIRTVDELRRTPRRGAKTGRRLAQDEQADGRTRTALASPLGRALGFAIAGGTGIVVNSAALALFFEVVGLPLAVSAACATQVSTLWNFLLIDRAVYRGRSEGNAFLRFLGFALINNLVLLLRLPLLTWLVDRVGLAYLVANVVTLAAAFLVRFLISDRYLFRTRSSHHDAHPREALVLSSDGRHRSRRFPARGGGSATARAARRARHRSSRRRVTVAA